jgi:hypothetical protein
MKKEFHARFTAILQILYKRERLSYFNNQIAINFDLANRAGGNLLTDVYNVQPVTD